MLILMFVMLEERENVVFIVFRLVQHNHAANVSGLQCLLGWLSR